MPLQINIGTATALGSRERNEDFCGAVTPEGSELASKGALLAISDGVGGSGGGREAAEAAVRGVLADYYATPETWEIPHALEKIISSINSWLHAQSGMQRVYAGMAATLSVLVLRGQRYVLAHVGDSRIYRLRGESFTQLTADHVWDRPEMSHVLKRAVGLDAHLAVDYSDGQLAVGDVFLLATDGVWEPLGQRTLHETLVLHQDPQCAADALVKQAITQGGQDNATAVVVCVEQLADEAMQDLLVEGRDLPVPPRLKIGQQLDGFEVLAQIHESRATLLYKVRDPANSQTLVLKTLPPALKDDAEAMSALLAEEWLAKRVVSHYFPQVVPFAPGQRSCLYYAMTWHEGETLQQKLDTAYRFPVTETAQLGIRLIKGLSALHQLNVVHRDIKPANLHLGSDSKLRILDLGVALNPLADQASGNPGTPSYMAPELFLNEQASTQSDLYAAGVTLYHLLTRKYPYGEIEPFQHPRFGEPVPPTRYRPDVPQWLENILFKAIARDKNIRFETAEEFLLALERGEQHSLLPPRPTPLAERDPLTQWQSVAVISLLVNLLLLYLFFVS